MHYISLIKDFFLNILFPATCPACGNSNSSFKSGFCPECFKKINFIKSPMCSVCGEPFSFAIGENQICPNCLNERPKYEIARSVFVYDDFSRNMILAFKHGDATYNSKFFALLFMSSFKQIIDEADVIIPVPLHKIRLITRKFNQAALIAKHIAKKTSKTYLADTLIREKNTKSQGNFNGKDRIINVKDAFKISNDNYIKDKHIILIDDVYTTGATVNECAKTMYNAGAKSIVVLTLAKVPQSKRLEIK